MSCFCPFSIALIIVSTTQHWLVEQKIWTSVPALTVDRGTICLTS